MDRKSQLSHVAFGGDWSEQIVPRETLQEALSVLERAVQLCPYDDMRTDRVNKALDAIRSLPKGTALATRFWESLSIQTSGIRYEAANNALRLIRSSAGVSLDF